MDKQFSEQEAAEKAFNIFCLKVLKNEAINAAKGLPKWQINEVCVPDITHREDILKDYDNYIIANYENEDRDFYSVGNKIITQSLITEAINILPVKTKTVLLLYIYDDISDSKISEILMLPRSTVQYHRNKGIKMIKKFLEEKAIEKKN